MAIVLGTTGCFSNAPDLGDGWVVFGLGLATPALLLICIAFAVTAWRKKFSAPVRSQAEEADARTTLSALRIQTARQFGLTPMNAETASAAEELIQVQAVFEDLGLLKENLTRCVDARIAFGGKGGFFGDAKLTVSLDGKFLGTGSQRTGFRFQVPTTLGRHVLKLESPGTEPKTSVILIEKEGRILVDLTQTITGFTAQTREYYV
jgi:hypothetical protein